MVAIACHANADVCNHKYRVAHVENMQKMLLNGDGKERARANNNNFTTLIRMCCKTLVSVSDTFSSAKTTGSTEDASQQCHCT